MPTATDIYGTVFKNGSTILMARIVGVDDQPIVQADVSAIEYSVYQLDDCDPDSVTSVSGHSEISLDKTDILFDTLQTGAGWSIDSVGYNLRHVVDVSSAEAFPVAGVSYQVRYEITPVSGQKVIVRFQLKAI